MRTHPESVVHMYNATFRVNSINKEFTMRMAASSPMTALTELHRVAQNTHHYAPDAYTVISLKRDGLAAYDIVPGMTNPDVRHIRKPGPRLETVEMFKPEEMAGSPTVSPEDAAL